MRPARAAHAPGRCAAAAGTSAPQGGSVRMPGRCPALWGGPAGRRARSGRLRPRPGPSWSACMAGAGLLHAPCTRRPCAGRCAVAAGTSAPQIGAWEREDAGALPGLVGRTCGPPGPVRSPAAPARAFLERLHGRGRVVACAMHAPPMRRALRGGGRHVRPTGREREDAGALPGLVGRTCGPPGPVRSPAAPARAFLERLHGRGRVVACAMHAPPMRRALRGGGRHVRPTGSVGA
jgi:hypothetical protein